MRREKRNRKRKRKKKENFIFLVLVLRLQLRSCQKSSSVKRQDVSAIVSAGYELLCLRRLCRLYSSVEVLALVLAIAIAIALVPTSLV